MIILTSDNWTGAHSAINEALIQHPAGGANAYGTSELDRKIEQKFADVFERQVAVYFVGTGFLHNHWNFKVLPFIQERLQTHWQWPT